MNVVEQPALQVRLYWMINGVYRYHTRESTIEWFSVVISVLDSVLILFRLAFNEMLLAN